VKGEKLVVVRHLLLTTTLENLLDCMAQQCRRFIDVKAKSFAAQWSKHVPAQRRIYSCSQRLGAMPGAWRGMFGGLLPPSGIQIRALRSPINSRTAAGCFAIWSAFHGSI